MNFYFPFSYFLYRKSVDIRNTGTCKVGNLHPNLGHMRWVSERCPERSKASTTGKVHVTAGLKEGVYDAYLSIKDGGEKG